MFPPSLIRGAPLRTSGECGRLTAEVLVEHIAVGLEGRHVAVRRLALVVVPAQPQRQLQRGLYIYQTRCQACHSLGLVRFSSLADLGWELLEGQTGEDVAKAIASNYEIPYINDDGEDDKGGDDGKDGTNDKDDEASDDESKVLEKPLTCGEAASIASSTIRGWDLRTCDGPCSLTRLVA